METVHSFTDGEEVYWDSSHVIFTVGASCCDLYVTREEALEAAHAIIAFFQKDQPK